MDTNKVDYWSEVKKIWVSWSEAVYKVSTKVSSSVSKCWIENKVNERVLNGLEICYRYFAKFFRKAFLKVSLFLKKRDFFGVNYFPSRDLPFDSFDEESGIKEADQVEQSSKAA